MTGREVGRKMAGRASRALSCSHLWLLLALLLSLSLPPALPAAGEETPGAWADPHSHFRNPSSCGRCHVYRESVLEPNRFVPESDAFCLGCHSPEGLGITHPRKLKPGDDPYRMTVPEDFRLDSEGRLFCLTCHSAHGPFLSPTRSYATQEAADPGAPPGTKPAFRTYFARRSDPVRGFATLCEGCHGKR